MVSQAADLAAAVVLAAVAAVAAEPDKAMRVVGRALREDHLAVVVAMLRLKASDRA